jgi:hypothetical protein
MAQSSGLALELWSTDSNTQILKMEKKGDFLMREFHLAKGGYIIYSDCKDT